METHPIRNEVQDFGGQDLSKTMSGLFSSVQHDIELYFDAKSLSLLQKILVENQERITHLRRNGARFRCLTEINRQNLVVCKDLMKSFELFHTSKLIGCFAIVDNKEYVGYLAYSEGNDRLLRVINPSFVSMQKFLFDAMIDKAISAIQRIKEIGKGVEEEFMETIRDPLKTKSLISSLVHSALFEIDILFSTRSSFLIAEREGILQEIGNVSAGGIKVKILVMHDEMVKEISNSKLKTPNLNVEVNYLQQLLPTKITTFIIDQARILTIEINDDTKETFNEAIGLCTFSNSESTVFSNVSMFESLWIQSEVDKQNKARQTYFQLFKGFKLKDEIYSRRWGQQQQ